MNVDTDIPPEAYWTKVGSHRRKHPYGIHKMVNMDRIEVICSVSDEDGHGVRYVLVDDGVYEVWVRAGDSDEYGYELQPDERVSTAELEAINLKQAAMRGDADVSVEKAHAFVEASDPKQLPHALIALYYAAAADAMVTEDSVEQLRELVHEHTNHVDTSHAPTVAAILDDCLSDEGEDATT